jgi:transcriptional regulator with XRE-family HTH domain
MEIKVGEIIRAKRLERNLTLTGLGGAVGVSAGYLSQIENGRKQNPKLEIVLRLIHHLDLDLAMLLGLEGAEESYLTRIPSLLKLVFARERNLQVLGDTDVQRRFCALSEKLLDARYVIGDRELYTLFLEDVRTQTDNTLKRYLALQLILDARRGTVPEASC